MKVDKEELDMTRIGVRLSRILLENGKVRFVVQDNETYQPLIPLSIYEAYLSKKHNSYKTVFDAIQKSCYIFSWAKKNRIDIDSILLSGEVLEPYQINTFGNWLENRGNSHNKKEIEQNTINAILTRTSLLFRWFANQYALSDCKGSERAVKVQIYEEAIDKSFSDHKKNDRPNRTAEDLTEEEIKKIEKFLLPENRMNNFPKLSEAQVIRDYLIWRLVIEFGLRIGEILALRLEDCPHQQQNYIKIVRIEARGSDYIDPRGVYAPRPKTLTRELGFILKNSPVKNLINNYITKHRRRVVFVNGRKIYKHIFDMPAYLIS